MIKRVTWPHLYVSPAIPLHWVALGADETVYLVPATVNGWNQRRPYGPGSITGLQRLDRAEAQAVCEMLGGAFNYKAPLADTWIDSEVIG